jgi:vacuolar-type H+-ATPase subunit H
MGMERVLSIQERLQKLLNDAEREAKATVTGAQKSIDDRISSIRIEANRKLAMAQRGSGIEQLLKEEEKSAEKEAEKILEEYDKKAEDLKAVPKKKRDSAVSFILKEVLPE